MPQDTSYDTPTKYENIHNKTEYMYIFQHLTFQYKFGKKHIHVHAIFYVQFLLRAN